MHFVRTVGLYGIISSTKLVVSAFSSVNISTSSGISFIGNSDLSSTSNANSYHIPKSSSFSTTSPRMTRDPVYPGTAVERLNNVHTRVKQLVSENALAGFGWEDIRRKLLWAGGLRDLPAARPGQGYTGHSFNDFNHVDLTCMLETIADNENDGSVKGIAIGNRLGNGIRIASLPELGPGGSWSTCALGCNKDPPADVAHIQFQSRIAFKLVWVPNEKYDMFVLVDDDGNLLATGKPDVSIDELPPLRERKMNYKLVEGSKYAVEADRLAKTASIE